jgi:hypothetical protein
MLKKHLFFAMAAATMLSTPIHAAVSSSEAAQLGNTLTPFGAEKAGNADGSIPAWTGGITTPPAGYKGPGNHHVDPFPQDKPLFTITKQNLDQYKDKLTAGEQALFETYPSTFKMPIYQTRRTGSAPQWVYDNTIKNATTAKLAEGGNGFTDAYAGIPFPIPKSGVEVIWNHVARYRGQYLVWPRMDNAVVQQNGTVAYSTSRQEVKFNYYDPKGSYAGLNNVMYRYTSANLEPARLAGNASLVHETLNQVDEPRKAWSYASGQRRVRRAPTLSYDTPIDGTEGLQTTDAVDMYNGAPDRFEWKLAGKKEIYIPYNNYRISAEGVDYKTLLTPGHLNPELARYELHRVWVVEATLKPGNRHIYSKRTFYVDEDSWQIVSIDSYDNRGTLWRASLAYLKNFYELPTTWTALEVYHDLVSRRYMVTNLGMRYDKYVDFNQPIPNDQYFEPSSLRSRGVR